MRMKKIFLVMAAMLCVATVSAQSKLESSVKQAAQTVAAQKWSLGLRVGAGAQINAECFYACDKYIDLRLGWGFLNGTADLTAIHNWNCCNWDWTPEVGNWYLDAGVGAQVGGNGNFLSAGIVGDVKFGIKFNKVPIRLALDVSPAFGPVITYGKTTTTEVPGDNGEVSTTTTTTPTKLGFYSGGLLNVALSATWCF